MQLEAFEAAPPPALDWERLSRTERLLVDERVALTDRISRASMSRREDYRRSNPSASIRVRMFSARSRTREAYRSTFPG